MVRLRAGELIPDAPALAVIASAHPGALWLIGNEPDVKWQDNTLPAEYARLYHKAYTAIKAADPQAQVAIGGVTQPSPLRLRYLDAVLTAYQQQYRKPLPVDIMERSQLRIARRARLVGRRYSAGHPGRPRSALRDLRQQQLGCVQTAGGRFQALDGGSRFSQFTANRLGIWHSYARRLWVHAVGGREFPESARSITSSPPPIRTRVSLPTATA